MEHASGIPDRVDTVRSCCTTATARNTAGRFLEARHELQQPMEVIAAIKALEALNKPCKGHLFSDSEFLVKAISLGWAWK